MNRRAIVAVLALVGCGDPVAPPATLSSTPAAASIAGIVRYTGAPLRDSIHPPAAPGMQRPIDPSRLKSLLLGEGNTMANVYVAVKSGLGDRRFPNPNQPALLRHTEWVYEPRVLGIMTNQSLKVRNEDDVVHNVHIPSDFSPQFNRGQVQGAEDTFQFPKPGIGIPVKCDVHPWERAWIHVSDHPFFAVTGLDGKYSITGLPPGEYEILAWHERFQSAPLTAKVKVVGQETATLDFTFEAPRK